jgi:hypothetical protein
MNSPANSAQAAASIHPRADRGLSVRSVSSPQLAGGASVSPAFLGQESKHLSLAMIQQPLINDIFTTGTKSPQEYFSCMAATVPNGSAP